MLLDSGVGGKAELLEKHVDFLVQKFSIFWTDISVDSLYTYICVTVLTLAHTCVTLPKLSKCEKV
jgi:hypothetical protein